MKLELVADGRMLGSFCLVALGVGGGYLLGKRDSPEAAKAATVPPAVQSAPVIESAPIPAPPKVASGKLAFSDEFDGTSLDAAKWDDCYPGGKRTHSNNEQQYYAPDGHEVKGGFLRFFARRRPMNGMPYTSGMVSSHGHFAQAYGRFEIRARMPKGQGMWPAFWLLPEDLSWPPEIDILEVLGHEPNRAYFSNHYGEGYQKHQWETQHIDMAGWSAGFHTYALDWRPDRMTWLVDGKPAATTTKNIPSTPMYILSNLAVGGDWPGMPDASTPFPGVMEIDYIRVYAP